MLMLSNDKEVVFMFMLSNDKEVVFMIMSYINK